MTEPAAFLHHIDRIWVNAGGNCAFALSANECFERGELFGEVDLGVL